MLDFIHHLMRNLNSIFPLFSVWFVILMKNDSFTNWTVAYLLSEPTHWSKNGLVRFFNEPRGDEAFKVNRGFKCAESLLKQSELPHMKWQ